MKPIVNASKQIIVEIIGVQADIGNIETQLTENLLTLKQIEDNSKKIIKACDRWLI